MRWLKGALAKMAAVIFPWAPRHERRAAIAAATAERERSRADAAHARAVERQIKRLAAENHYAESIARGIRQGHRNGGTA